MDKQITFILCRPAVPANIGAAARAIKTMGFHEIRLVNTSAHREKEAYWLAHASEDILNNAKQFCSLKEAIHDIDFIIGTSAKKRRIKHDYYLAEDLAGIIENKGSSIKKIAIVFGSEESGLNNKELEECDIITYIPMEMAYPSLNLSQAVMLYAYILKEHKAEFTQNQKEIADNPESYKVLKRKVYNILDKLDFPEKENARGRIMERLAIARQEDLQLIFKICQAFDK